MALNGTSSRGDWWRATALTLAAVLISVLGSWVAFGRDSVSQSQVKNLIDQTSPYAIDRSGIQAQLATNAHTAEVLSELLHDHEQRLDRIEAQVAALEQTEGKEKAP